MEEFEINNKLDELDKKINQEIPQNQAVNEQNSVGQQIIQTNQFEAPNPQITPSEQANRDEMLLKLASNDPLKMATTMVSQETINIMKNDEGVKQQVKELSKDTAETAMDTLSKKNLKARKQNFFEANEKDIVPLGGDKTSSRGQQISIVAFRRLFWILLMSTFGFFYLAPMSVLLEIFQSISFKQVSKQEMISKTDVLSNKTEPQTVYTIKRYKLGYIGSIVGSIMSIGWAAAVISLTVIFPKIMLWIAIGVCGLLIIINLLAPINFRKILNRKSSSIESTEKKSEAIVIEEEVEN